MEDDALYESLGKLTEEMYFGLAKTQSARMQDQLVQYHALAEHKISELLDTMSRYRMGEVVYGQQKKIRIFRDDFSKMKSDINNKYKVYIRGCGNAGKSTLLNALLSLEESTGSRMGRLPMTFIIDTYTDEFEAGKAEIRFIERDGTSRYERVTRKQAIRKEDEEERVFAESVKKCREIINERTKNVFLESEREDIETDVYKKYLYKTRIREIQWGIGKNNFFHNCILIDTPGLSQELRFTNVLEDVRNYEVDGIIWVISSETLAKQEVTDSYQKELQEMKPIYEGKRAVAVINMYGSTPDYQYGSRLWKRVEKKARKIYCGENGFDDLICVNAKMAYDGNINGDQRLLEESNISELRKKINELFTERSSESYHYAKLDKIDDFLDKLYKEVEEYRKAIESFVEKYEQKEKQIFVQASACENLVEEQKEKIVRRYLADIESRIEMNLQRIEYLDQEPPEEQQYFLNEQIIRTDMLTQDLRDMLTSCGQLIYDRFKEQQLNSIISGYKTKKFACQAFNQANTGLALEQNRIWLDPKINSSGWDVIGDLLTQLLGQNVLTRAGRGILRFVKNMIKSPQKRVYEQIESSIRGTVRKLNLSEEIGLYQERCMETLEKSMEQTCGSYTDMKELISDMIEFLDDQPMMEWEKVGLQELLGGITNV